jgi:hypothetical protein
MAEDTGGQRFDSIFSGDEREFLKLVKGTKRPLPVWTAFEDCLRWL